MPKGKNNTKKKVDPVKRWGSSSTAPGASSSVKWLYALAAAVALLVAVAAFWWPLNGTAAAPTTAAAVGGARKEGAERSVSQRKAGFSAADIADVLAVEKQVWGDGAHPHLSNHTRIFGEKTVESAGHSATYLHAHVGTTPRGRAFMKKLRHLVMELSEEAGWGIASSDILKDLRPRAVESIRYGHGDAEGGGEQTTPTIDSPAKSIGWHSDFMSVMTVSVMLSPSDARSGGDFQTRRLGPHDDPQSYHLDLGDVTVWKSWDRHRVQPLTGHRHVLAVQWWIAPAHTSKTSGPAPSYYFTEGKGDTLLPYVFKLSA